MSLKHYVSPLLSRYLGRSARMNRSSVTPPAELVVTDLPILRWKRILAGCDQRLGWLGSDVIVTANSDKDAWQATKAKDVGIASGARSIAP